MQPRLLPPGPPAGNPWGLMGFLWHRSQVVSGFLLGKDRSPIPPNPGQHRPSSQLPDSRNPRQTFPQALSSPIPGPKLGRGDSELPWRGQSGTPEDSDPPAPLPGSCPLPGRTSGRRQMRSSWLCVGTPSPAAPPTATWAAPLRGGTSTCCEATDVSPDVPLSGRPHPHVPSWWEAVSTQWLLRPHVGNLGA